MNHTKIYLIVIIIFSFIGLYAKADDSQDIRLFFEPNLLACKINSGNIYDCELVENESSSEIKIAQKLLYIVNDREFWSGEYFQKLSYNNHHVEFKIISNLQIEKGTQSKIYDLKIQIKDSLLGTATYSLSTDNLEKINLTHINLPEIKQGDLSYFISLKYSAWTQKLEKNIFHKVADMYFDNEQFGETYVAGTRPINVVPWEDGVLPIVFKSGVSDEIKNLVWSACKEWSSVAQVKCISGAYKNKKLVIANSYLGVDGGCWSMLGQSSYFLWLKRRMNIGKGCNTYTTILHELGHALGLGHEHQRPDRDSYVKILSENISDPFMGLNEKLNFSTQEGVLLTPYDFYSIMHYSKNAFTKNGRATILPVEGFESYADIIGRAQNLSQYDILAIQKIYGKSARQD